MNIPNDYKKLFIIRNIFDNYGIKLIFTYGTLIGMIRENKPISYDNGHDAFILEEDIYKMFDDTCSVPFWKKKVSIRKEIINDFNKHNIKLSRHSDHNGSIKIIFDGCRLHIITLYKLDEDRYEFITSGNIYPTLCVEKPVEIKNVYKNWKYDISFLIPNHYVKFLDGLYTDKRFNKDWRIPCGRAKITQNCSASPHIVLLDKNLNMTFKSVFDLKNETDKYGFKNNKQKYLSKNFKFIPMAEKSMKYYVSLNNSKQL